MDRVAAVAAGADVVRDPLRCDERCHFRGGCLHRRPSSPFPSEPLHPYDGDRVAVAGGAATGDGDDGATGDQVVREYRSHASIPKRQCNSSTNFESK